jgi:ABC-2 type transport system ATP-binding protein
MASPITAQSLSMRFRHCEALSNVSLDVAPGTVFAILGENGAGKTTLIKILTGFLDPTSGSCQVLGLDPRRDALEIRRRIGYVSDSPALYDWMRVDEIGWFTSSFYECNFLERYRELVRDFELPSDRKIRQLSKGGRAKVALALALSHDPELLILDEPTSGLDPLVRREFLESMVARAAAGRTVFLSSHQIAEIERVADTVAILHRGSFSIVDSLADLKESVHEVTIALSDPLVTLPLIDAPARLLREEVEGRQRRWIVQGWTPEMLASFQRMPGVITIRDRQASLDEIFIACVRGTGDSQPQLVEAGKE